MRKTVKKLTLSKETLRRLEAVHLKDAAGGTTGMCPTGGAYTCGCVTGTNCDISLCICD